MSYAGSCHCGAVTFTVTGDAPDEAMSCNCSHCRRKGFLLTFVPADQFTLESGGDGLTSYQFYKHKITHQFCATCGAQAFALAESPNGPMRAINLRCVPDIDIDALRINRVDGASF
ncbi:aldehyde-activating protein [Sphingobium quisquiliarum P25]|uniref:Aldehyde-activating protein n=1 Tax=Sphingobium quisquiliarum P25 TaxID=1329909 RepID=T0IKE5_9SPHN|nr:GFA family protein [Sphingobium quisquiliarum]EQB10134.1 aldehyde-activating protein [Sphingobium quisquiliarum P25]